MARLVHYPVSTVVIQRSFYKSASNPGQIIKSCNPRNFGNQYTLFFRRKKTNYCI